MGSGQEVRAAAAASKASTDARWTRRPFALSPNLDDARTPSLTRSYTCRTLRLSCAATSLTFMYADGSAVFALTMTARLRRLRVVRKQYARNSQAAGVLATTPVVCYVDRVVRALRAIRKHGRRPPRDQTASRTTDLRSTPPHRTLNPAGSRQSWHQRRLMAQNRKHPQPHPHTRDRRQDGQRRRRHRRPARRGRMVWRGGNPRRAHPHERTASQRR